jgi:chromatin remodeling complex protein RSC6
MKQKSFCTTKEMISKLKRPPTEWEKIFASYISENIRERTDKQNIQRSQKTKLPQNYRSGQRTEDFSKEEIQMAKKKKKRKNAHHPWP